MKSYLVDLGCLDNNHIVMRDDVENLHWKHLDRLSNKKAL
jgi:hypothetical protein